MKGSLLLILILLGIVACQKPPPYTPRGSLHPYTEAQLKVLQRWKQSYRVDQSQRITQEDREVFMRQQLTSRFRQPLIIPRGRIQPTHGKRCWVSTECGWGFRCVQGICVGGSRPEKYGRCLKAKLSHFVCSNTGEDCESDFDCEMP